MRLYKQLRDCQAWKDENLPMSTTSNEAAKLFDAGLHQLIGWYEDEEYGGLMGTCQKMIKADENFVFGHIFTCGLRLIGTGETARTSPDLSQALDRLWKTLEVNRRSLNDRETLHIEALKHFADGFWQNATEIWETILIDHPTDLFALKMAHDAYFYLGEQSCIRDSVLRVLPYFKPGHYFYGYLKGMLSFGQVETNMFKEAEKSAREALHFNKNDAWACHGLAHVFEMQARLDEGSKFLHQFENDWKPCGILACHLYWHWCLYTLEKGDYAGTLKIYDEQISKRSKSGAMLDIVDATSLLYRLEMEGVNVETRWEDVVELCRPHATDQISIFNDLHFLMAFTGGRNSSSKLMDQQKKAIQNYLNLETKSSYEQIRHVGSRLYTAMVSYANEEYDNAVDLIYPIKHKIVQIGGSNAQRDLFNQLLIHSCIKSESPRNKKLARHLLFERQALKPGSPLTERMMAKLLSCHCLGSD